jgi:hypothetical protein
MPERQFGTSDSRKKRIWVFHQVIRRAGGEIITNQSFNWVSVLTICE